MKKVTTKTIILSENVHMVNVKRLMVCVMLPLKYNPVKLIGNIGGGIESSVSSSNGKSEGKGGKQQNFHLFFSKLTTPKKESGYDTQGKSQDLLDAVVKVPVKRAKKRKRQKKI